MVLDHLRDILPSQGRLLSLEVAQGESTLHASTREVFWRGSKGGIRGLVQTLRLYHFAPTSRSWVYPGMGPSRDPPGAPQAPEAMVQPSLQGMGMYMSLGAHLLTTCAEEVLWRW
jgi:hypothetical protein